MENTSGVNVETLEGEKLGEKKKKLNEILKSEELENILTSSFKSEDCLNKLFRIEILSKLKVSAEIINILKSEDVTLINKVLRCNWFFESANIKKLDIEYIFANVSFSTRVKILKKISIQINDEEHAEQIFETVSKKYGHKFAMRLLPACSTDFIKSVFTGNIVALSHGQLMRIIKKDVNLFTVYVDQMNQKKDFDISCLASILRYLALHRTNMFIQLTKTYNININLSRRTTKKIVKIDRERIIKNPKDLLGVLHNKELAKCLRGDFRRLVMALYPEEIESWNFFSYNLLNLVKTENRGKFILDTFQEKYGKSLLDYPDLITFDVLKVLPKEEREKVAELKEEKNKDKIGHWLVFARTNKSIPRFMELIKTTSDVTERTRYINCVLKTCKFNNDTKALAEFCKYFVKRHRNEILSVREAFCETLNNNFDLAKLTDEHWTHINELLEIFTVNKEVRGYTYFIYEIRIKQVEFNFLNNKPFKELYMDILKTFPDYHVLNVFTEIPALEKQSLLFYSEKFSQEKSGKEQNLIEAIDKWNKRHPEDHILPSSFPWIKKYVENTLTNNLDKMGYYDIQACVLYFENSKKDFNDTMFALLKLKLYIDSKRILCCLHHKPELVTEHLVDIVEYIFERDRVETHTRLFQMCKYFSYINIPQNIIKICFDKLRDENGKSENKCKALQIISLLGNADQFLTSALPYYPVDKKMDVCDKNAHELFEIQKSVAWSLYYINPPSQALMALLNFCTGDYLKMSVRSLYSVCHRSAEVKIVPFLKQLLDRPVSIKKHGIWLTCKVLPKDIIFAMLSTLLLTEKNISIRETLFSEIFRYFLLERNKVSWELLKTCIDTVDVTDKESVKKLTQLNTIPMEYIVEFVLCSWNKLYKLSQLDRKLWEHNCELIDHIDKEIIVLLPDDFNDRIVNDYFLNIDQTGAHVLNVESFTCNYLAYVHNDAIRNKRFDVVMAKVKHFIDKEWGNFNLKTKTYSNRKIIFDFCESFRSVILKSDKIPLPFVEKFVQFWNNTLPPVSSFSLYLFFEMLLRLYSSKCILNGIFIGEIERFFNHVVKKYGLISTKKFSSKLKEFLYHSELPDKSIYPDKILYFCDMLLATNKSVENCLLVVNLLPNVPSKLCDLVIYEKILMNLQNVNEPILQLHLNEQLNSNI